MHWGYNFYNAQHSLYPIDPYRCTDAGGAFPSGDPFLVYPGKDGRPEESQRLMLMDQAMSDYCALTVLEQLAGREKALACINKDLSFHNCLLDEVQLLALRERINHAIQAALDQDRDKG